MTSQIEKNKQYEIVKELYDNKMIDSSLVQELSTTIESNFKFKKDKTSRDRLDILQYVPVNYQLLVPLRSPR